MNKKGEWERGYASGYEAGATCSLAAAKRLMNAQGMERIGIQAVKTMQARNAWIAAKRFHNARLADWRAEVDRAYWPETDKDESIDDAAEKRKALATEFRSAQVKLRRMIARHISQVTI